MNGVILCVQRDGCRDWAEAVWGWPDCKMSQIFPLGSWSRKFQVRHACIQWGPQTIFCLHVTGLKTQAWGLALSQAIYDKKKRNCVWRLWKYL